MSTVLVTLAAAWVFGVAVGCVFDEEIREHVLGVALAFVYVPIVVTALVLRRLGLSKRARRSWATYGPALDRHGDAMVTPVLSTRNRAVLYVRGRPGWSRPEPAPKVIP